MTIWSQQMKTSVQTTCHLSRIDPSPCSDLGPLTTVLSKTRPSGFLKKSLAKGCGVNPTVQPNYINNIFTILFVNTNIFFCIVFKFWNLFYFNTFYILSKKKYWNKSKHNWLNKNKTIAFMIIIYFLKFWSTLLAKTNLYRLWRRVNLLSDEADISGRLTIDWFSHQWPANVRTWLERRG